MIKSEIWLNIKGFEYLYKISNLGRVKSLRWNKELILKQTTNKRGYKSVGLHKQDQKTKTIEVHQLVAAAFLNHIPCGRKLVIDHIDFNKLNNRLDNLQIITFRENCTRGRTGVSKYTGVSWHRSRNKWISAIRINGKKIHLGYFTNEDEAGMAYVKKLNKLNKTNNFIKNEDT